MVLRVAAALVAAMITACGGSSGGPDSTTSELALLVGQRAGDAPERTEAMVLRFDGSAWQTVSLPSEQDQQDDLLGAAFSSPATAWVFGRRGYWEISSYLLFQSIDSGFSWTDVSQLLPDTAGVRVDAIAFSDPMTGWLIGRDNFYSGPIPLSTKDSGMTWERGGSGCAFGDEGPRGVFRLCDGSAELFCDLKWKPLGPAPGTENYCEPMNPFAYDYDPRLDVRADGSGVACDDEFGPVASGFGRLLVCSSTQDHGLTWTETTRRPLNEDFHYIGGLVFLEGDRAFLTVNRLIGQAQLLESRDRGASWEEASLPVDDVVNLGGLARSSWVTDR
jgi:hypothetical protein